MRDRSAGLQVLTQLIVKEEEAGEFEIGFEELAKLILGQFKYEFDTKDYGRFIRHPDLLMRNTSEATIQARDHLFYHVSWMDGNLNRTASFDYPPIHYLFIALLRVC